MPRYAHSERVVVWTARNRDADFALQILERGGFATERCEGLADLEAKMEAGAGCAVLAEEVLTDEVTSSLRRRKLDVTSWSDFPFIVFCARPGGSHEELGNVSRLDRPVRVATLLSTVGSALRARRRQYEAEEAIRLRDQFLAMLGHELRNPLGAIVLAVEILNRTPSGASAKHRGVIDRQARHLARLVDDLLDVSRVTSGKVALKRVPLDLDELLRRCLQSVEPAARAKSIQVGFARSHAGLTVEADSVRLEQVFSNLLVNAIKYSPAGSSVELSLSAERDTAVVRVTDNGIGIAPEMLDRIFEMFVQAESSLDRAQGGLGIGLTLVKSLVELHGGSVTAHSEGRNRGSEFAVRLPLAARTAGTIDAPSPPSPARAPLRVVLVEDNADIRESLCDYFGSIGYELQTAADGPSGLAVILAHRPDVALVDIGLPLLDGYAVARRVRAALGNGVRLIAVSGYGQAEDRQRALSAGFDEHLTKPVTLVALDELLSRVAQRADQRARQ